MLPKISTNYEMNHALLEQPKVWTWPDPLSSLPLDLVAYVLDPKPASDDLVLDPDPRQELELIFYVEIMSRKI